MSVRLQLLVPSSNLLLCVATVVISVWARESLYVDALAPRERRPAAAAIAVPLPPPTARTAAAAAAAGSGTARADNPAETSTREQPAAAPHYTYIYF